jgi:hypothetical protein
MDRCVHDCRLFNGVDMMNILCLFVKSDGLLALLPLFNT